MQTNQDQTNEMLYRRDLYIITARTNMHVGSGDEAYGLVDNRVQRDVVTKLPNINASGLKGALREYFSDKWGEKSQEVIEIFGSDSFEKTAPGEKKIHQAGAFRFFNANLLSIPVRSNVKPFFRATSPHVVTDLIEMMDTFGYPDECGIKEHLQQLAALKPEKGKAFTFDSTVKDAVLEDYEYTVEAHQLAGDAVTVIKGIIGDNPVLMNELDFMDICDDYHLPLIARNCLDNGRSTNLWHEQVVPRESRFYFFLLKPLGSMYDLEFSQGDPVQIGGNASIGYGFTRIEKIGKKP
ncbi:MAG: type III-B CRISPR module RAMP protein Cmr4 [Candidatus Aminicenantes bacterium]|nr:type III-B CRISPR module RAMP protein Cmr4 [Candidatus Aminicenantes bacterium]